MQWGEFALGWKASLIAAGRADTTVRVYLGTLAACGAWCAARGLEPADVDGETLVQWVGRHRWAANSRKMVRSALRSAWAWGVRTGQLEVNVALELPSVRRPAPRPHPTPEHAYASALRAAPPREHLMLRLAAEAGLRRAEVAGVHRSRLVDGAAGWDLWVLGKGSKERLVPLTDGLARELRVRCGEGYAFPSPRGGHLTPGHVGALIAAALPEGYSMHSLRHRFATRAYALSSGDLFAVQELLGHASPVTTRMYVQLGGEVKRRLVEAVGQSEPASAPPALAQVPHLGRERQERRLVADGEVAALPGEVARLL